MNKEIKPEYVTFEQAKWLKEIGFNEKCSHYYIDNFQNFKHDGVLYKCGLPDKNENKNLFQFVTRKNQPHLCNAPEQWQVVEWLRVNHGIWVEVCHNLITEQFFFEIVMNEGETHHNNEKLLFDTPQEACSAAFDYIKENILKHS